MNQTRKILCILGITSLLMGIGFSQMNMPNASTVKNASEEGGGTLVQDISNFLTSTSPAFLIILGIVLIIGSGFAKIIGYILIVYAIIRLMLTLI